MARDVFFEWTAEGYLFEQKSSDWFWAVGIIAVAAAVASILFGNFILALLVVVAATTLSLSAMKRPRAHRFRLADDGLWVDDTLYDYDDILSFSVLEYIDPKVPPALSLRTRKFLVPHLLVPLVNVDPVEVYEFFFDQVEEGRHDQSLTDRIIDYLRL